MPINGQLFIGSTRESTEHYFQAVDAATADLMPERFSIADASHVERACECANEAFEPFRSASLEDRAGLLEKCALNIEGLGDELLIRAAAESGLQRARLETERGRTVNQLKLFAQVVRRGDWLGLRIDHAQPERKPLPRSDLRMRKVPLGPVTVFGASNFPLAFSAGGGDVASALAAGCPVVVKGHPAHPGTSELVAGAIVAAVKDMGLPSGVYSHLSGSGNDLGAALVRHPAIQAVAFTGSRAGGEALVKLASNRAVPIPVYAEMSSVNPVIILPAALRARHRALASSFVASLTLGVGQFCTNPGVILLIDSPEADSFIATAAAELSGTSAAPMLTQAIHAKFEQGVGRLSTETKAECHARGPSSSTGGGAAALFSVIAKEFIADERLREEVFGPSSIIVHCANALELEAALRVVEGQLTITMHADPEDYDYARSLIPIAELKAGRLVFNGWPTGVEVAPAMVHGGPYPATSAAWTTSVGTLAIDRFLRPVCYQDFPADLLPEELRVSEARRFRVMTNGQYTDVF